MHNFKKVYMNFKTLAPKWTLILLFNELSEILSHAYLYSIHYTLPHVKLVFVTSFPKALQTDRFSNHYILTINLGKYLIASCNNVIWYRALSLETSSIIYSKILDIFGTVRNEQNLLAFLIIIVKTII